MGLLINSRISLLLDQLQDKDLTKKEIAKIKSKIAYLRGLK